MMTGGREGIVRWIGAEAGREVDMKEWRVFPSLYYVL